MEHEEGNLNGDDLNEILKPHVNRRQRSSIIEAHQIFMQYHRDSHHENDDDEKETKAPTPITVVSKPSGATSTLFPMFHRVQKTGVIYATSRATSRGFNAKTETEWANMGQGAPETGKYVSICCYLYYCYYFSIKRFFFANFKKKIFLFFHPFFLLIFIILLGPLPNAPTRNFHMNIEDAELEYAPVTGLAELRTKVADYYNTLYRSTHTSKYTADNVCIVPGGRAGITRIMAVLGNIQIGYFTPDYTAYEQALGLFIRVSPSPMLHRNINEAYMEPNEFEFQVAGRGTGAVLMSNPTNPTGQSLEGNDLKRYVDIAREYDTAIIMDEFYS